MNVHTAIHRDSLHLEIALHPSIRRIVCLSSPSNPGGCKGRPRCARTLVDNMAGLLKHVRDTESFDCHCPVNTPQGNMSQATNSAVVDFEVDKQHSRKTAVFEKRVSSHEVVGKCELENPSGARAPDCLSRNDGGVVGRLDVRRKRTIERRAVENRTGERDRLNLYRGRSLRLTASGRRE